MSTQAPLAWRSEAFAEDVAGAELPAAPAYPWARHATWLCTLPLVAAVLGGVMALLQALA